MKSKICRGCKKRRLIKFFRKYRNKCVDCEREGKKRYYYNNQEKIKKYYQNHKPEFYRRQQDRIIKKRNFIVELKAVSCIDCNKKYPSYVMDFDHVRGKKLFNIGTAVAKGMYFDRKLNKQVTITKKMLLAEIAKCDVVCSNCHRERTHKRSKCKNGLCKR